jgi:hypothetical protein
MNPSSQDGPPVNESVEAIERLLRECTEDERKAVRTYLRSLQPHPLEREWGIDADTILSAISRSSDLTKRGVRGIIAEAIFVDEVIPQVADIGWAPAEIIGDQPYDALLKKHGLAARIQVKLQRLEEGKPKHYYPKHYLTEVLYVVEVQKTRTGEKRAKKTSSGTDAAVRTIASVAESTRPYSFGDFDILAVNMHPSSGNWKSFRYTVASWLLPRPANENLIEIFQPVPEVPNSTWTDRLSTCLQWYESAKEGRVLADLLHLRQSRKPK